MEEECQGFGHVGKVCREKKDTCGRCAGGHRTDRCEETVEQVACVNCRKEGRRADHPAFWKECGALKRAEERYMSKIDYES